MDHWLYEDERPPEDSYDRCACGDVFSVGDYKCPECGRCDKCCAMQSTPYKPFNVTEGCDRGFRRILRELVEDYREAASEGRALTISPERYTTIRNAIDADDDFWAFVVDEHRCATRREQMEVRSDG